MGAKKIKPVTKAVSKQPVLPPDSRYEQIREWVEAHYAILVGAGAAILFVFISTWGISMYRHSKEASAQTGYAVVAAKVPAEGKGTQADWEKLIPDFQKFISEYEGTSAALNAQLDLARAFFETKRYDDAVKTAVEALKEVPSDHRLAPLIHYHLAFAYTAAGKADEAAAEWTYLKNTGIRDYERQAGWNLGRIYAGKKDRVKAEEMFHLAAKAPGDYPQTAVIEREIARLKAEAGTQGPAK